jgi:hypothetical protein
MPIFKTKQNRVVADDPESEDLFVRVTWFGPDADGLHRRAFDGPVQPIEEYQAAIDWAVSMADQMQFPLYVVPMTAQDALCTDRTKRAVTSLSSQERGELRKFLITQMAEVMRDCDDPNIRRDAYAVLGTMGVVG